VIRPPRKLRAENPVFAGNTILYGATGGDVFIAGRVGERFAVRNSGANAVVEGVGDHGCEYMTGGQVIVLGKIGFNFGAGMSGGVAYLYASGDDIVGKINLQMVDADAPDLDEIEEIRRWIEKHAWLTGSARAQDILDDWENAAQHFVAVRSKRAVTQVAPVIAEPALEPTQPHAPPERTR